jgi:hypothetical protein
MSELVSRSGADTESYQAHRERKNNIDPSTSPRDLMDDALIAEAPAPVEEQRPATTPVITPEIVKENLRRVKAGAQNTLITIHPDGTRSYKHDGVVREGDGRIGTVRADRGEGTRDSLKLLDEEGAVKVDGLLPPKRQRDGSGTRRSTA